MNREYHRWYSPRLQRDMEVLLFGSAGEPLLLFPTSRGRFYQNEDFGMIGAIADRIDAGRYVVMCVDSVDDESWFNKGAHPHDRLVRHEQYERYIVEEAVPMLRQKSSGGRLTVAGCSLGGFHTVNLGLRHPDVFDRYISLGGKFETEDFLDGYHDELAYFHSVFQWLPNLDDRGRLDRLQHAEIILAAGEHDFCRDSNERLSALLWRKDIGNHLSVWGGAVHDWPVWREMFPLYMPF